MNKRTKSDSTARALCDAIYNGQILTFRQLSSMHKLITFTKTLCENELYPVHPTSNHTDDHTLQRINKLYRDYPKNNDVKSHWKAIFADIGFSTAAIAVDRMRLRFQIVQNNMNATPNVKTDPLHHHRDTWGSNIYAQINWWAPVYPVSIKNSMVIFSDYWTKPTHNTSNAYDLPTVIHRNRDKTSGIMKAADVVPQLIQPIDPAAGETVLIEPGDLVAFSGAHLHASIPNTSRHTRISLETRSVLIEDFINGRGARNIDGASRWMAPGWFARLSDSKRLSSIVGVNPVTGYKSWVKRT